MVALERPNESVSNKAWGRLRNSLAWELSYWKRDFPIWNPKTDKTIGYRLTLRQREDKASSCSSSTVWWQFLVCRNTLRLGKDDNGVRRGTLFCAAVSHWKEAKTDDQNLDDAWPTLYHHRFQTYTMSMPTKYMSTTYPEWNKSEAFYIYKIWGYRIVMSSSE